MEFRGSMFYVDYYVSNRVELDAVHRMSTAQSEVFLGWVFVLCRASPFHISPCKAITIVPCVWCPAMVGSVASCFFDSL